MVIRIGTLGNDTLVGTSGADILIDTAGDNSLYGGGGNDLLTGGTGRDLLDGGSGHDVLAGWAADDRLVGGGSNDLIDGGSGNDAAVFAGNRDGYVVTDLGQGVFRVRDIAAGIAGNDGTDRVSHVERLVFADQTVILDGQANRAPVAVDDALAAQAEDSGPRTIAFTALTGNDTDADGDALTVVAVGDAAGGTAEIVGGEVVFTAAADFTGSAGFDYTVEDGNGGSDTGQARFDVTLVDDAPVAVDDRLADFPASNGIYTIAFSQLTGNDTDADGDALTVSAVGNATGGTVSIQSGLVMFNVTAPGAASFDYTVSDGNGGTDLGRASFDAPRSGSGLFTAGDDVVDLNGFDLALYTTTAATDALAGDDTVTLSRTENLGGLFAGNAGRDTITGTGAADTIDGGADNDRVFGGDGSDVLTGGAGDDFLEGGAGNDALEGGAGADSMDGGEGDYDAVSYVGAAVQVDLGDNANNRFGDAEGDQLTGIEIVWATANNDRIAGDAGANVLYGLGCNDTLIGGGGDDRLVGGAGRDQFVFAPGSGKDLLEGFASTNSDIIDLTGYANIAFDDLTFTTRGPSTFVDIGRANGGGAGVDVLQVWGTVGAPTLDASDFIFA